MLKLGLVAGLFSCSGGSDSIETIETKEKVNVVSTEEAEKKLEK